MALRWSEPGQWWSVPATAIAAGIAVAVAGPPAGMVLVLLVGQAVIVQGAVAAALARQGHPIKDVQLVPLRAMAPPDTRPQRMVLAVCAGELVRGLLAGLLMAAALATSEPVLAIAGTLSAAMVWAAIGVPGVKWDSRLRNCWRAWIAIPGR